MSNDYFNDTLGLQDFTRARAASINGLSQQIETGFDLLPALALFSKTLSLTVTAGGTANAVTVANGTPITVYALGQRVSFKAIASNTGASTVNVDGLGVKTILRGDGNALSAGDITTGRVVDLVYDGANFRIVGTITTINAAGIDVVIAAATDAVTAADASADAAAASAAAAAASIAPYNAADVLSKLLTVDGSGSGVDTDLVRATTPSATGLALLGTASAGAAKTTLALENVNNTADANKPVSTATQTALDLKAPIANPIFTGTVTAGQAPTADLHVATKAWVETSIEGLLNLQAKAACAVIAVSNITLSGEQTIDGVLTSASRVLVAGQSTASQNGIYVSAAGAWARSTDADTWGELVTAAVLVSSGTLYNGSRWQTTTVSGGTLNTTSINWVQITSGGSFTASDGITKTSLNFALSSAPTQTFKGNNTGGAAIPTDLTAAQATAMLNTFGAAKGLTPAVTSNGTQYLRDDATWTSAMTPASVAASGTVTASNLSGTNTGDQTITLTGDVSGTGPGSFATTIASNAVTLAKLATVSTQTFLGRTTASTGNVEALTVAQAKTMLNLTGTNSGDQTTVTGNAGTATALQTARTIAISGAVTGTATSFNGTAAITIPITALDVGSATDGTLAVARGGTGATTSTGSGNVVLSASPTLSGTAAMASATFSGTAGLAAGTAALPSLRFSSDTNTGLYWIGADQLGIATGGVNRVSVSTTAVTSTLPVIIPSGSISNLSLQFAGDSNTGIYNLNANEISFVAGGTTTFTVNSSGVLAAGNLVVSGGRLTLPSTPPASATATGSAGQIEWDASYIYICTGTNTWKRVAISTW